jgi:hypothetical protein
MQELKLLLLEKGDSQKNLVDKANFNFSQVLSFEGGPYGKLGPEGRTGNSGSKGPSGSFGPQGKRGNIWTVLITPPPNPLNGDYWMNPNSNNEIRIYNSSTGVWDLYSVNINGLDIFREFGPLQTQTGTSSKNGYFTSLPYPDLNTFVLSDSYLTSGSSIANPQYTKMVISTNSQITERRLLEFTKGPYHGTSFNQETPSFFWTTGPTSSNGNYGLGFLCPQSLDFNLGGDFNLKSLSGSIIIKSAPYSPSFYRINKFINGLYSSSSSNGNLNITANSGSDSILFKSKNINIGSSTSNINTSTTLDIQTTGTTGSEPSLNLVTLDPDAGNLYYKMDEIYPSTRSGSTLFKATNSATSILEISGKGDFKVDKIMYPLHPLEDPNPINTGSFPSDLPVVGWRIFNPTVALNGNTDSNSFNVSRGSDFYITPRTINPGITEWGVCLWVPATGGSFGENGGWLNLLEDSEYVNFRVHSANTTFDGFRYVGINTGNTKNSAPGSSLTGSSRVDLGSRADSVEFTIINLSKTAGSTAGNKRWFKVLYQAYGGITPICGELYTNLATP